MSKVSSGEGPNTGGTAVTPLFAAVDADVSEPALPACGAVGVVAELGLRVQRRSSRGTVWRPCSEGCSVDPRFPSLNHPHHGALGCYRSSFGRIQFWLPTPPLSHPTRLGLCSGGSIR